MKIEKRIKLYNLNTDVWLPEDADILDLALENKLLQLVVWENVLEEVRHKRRFIYIVANDIVLDARGSIYLGSIFDPELNEMVYVFEFR